MPDFLISSGKNVADLPYLFQKLRFRISHLLLERVISSIASFKLFLIAWFREYCTFSDSSVVSLKS